MLQDQQRVVPGRDPHVFGGHPEHALAVAGEVAPERGIG
jgi:hypothetical protein